MILYNRENNPVEVNYKDFSSVQSDGNLGFTLVQLKDGTIEWLKATKEEIEKAASNPPR